MSDSGEDSSGPASDASRKIQVMEKGEFAKVSKPEKTRKTRAAPSKLPEELRQLGTNHPLRILLVEDNVINQKVTAKYLAQLGYVDYDICSNGLEVIGMLKQKKLEQNYDVIFMDLHMPEMNGHETAKRIRSMYREEEQPTIIALTASDSVEDTIECLKLGFEHYLSKPITAADVAAILLKCDPIEEEDDEEEEEPRARKNSW